VASNCIGRGEAIVGDARRTGFLGNPALRRRPGIRDYTTGPRFRRNTNFAAQMLRKTYGVCTTLVLVGRRFSAILYKSSIVIVGLAAPPSKVEKNMEGSQGHQRAPPSRRFTKHVTFYFRARSHERVRAQGTTVFGHIPAMPPEDVRGSSAVWEPLSFFGGGPAVFGWVGRKAQRPPLQRQRLLKPAFLRTWLYAPVAW